MKHLALFYASILSAIIAGADVPAKPFRPYPELQDVLMYEGFESPTTFFEKGKIDSDVVQTPGTHSYKLGEVDWGRNDKWLGTNFNLNAVKIPAGMDPNNLYVYFMMWTDETGEIITKFHEGDFEKKESPQKIKTWFPVMFKLYELGNKGKRIDAKMSFNWCEILFKPHSNKEYPKVYIDDFCVTSNVKPPDILPRILVSEHKRSFIVRSVAKDGFNYTLQDTEILKSALKASLRRRKPKSVVVFGPSPADGEALVKGLNSESATQKTTGFKFDRATAPDDSPAGGLDDMRTLLSFNIQKQEAETALLVLGYGDMTASSRPGENIRAILERALAMGCIPIVCLPAPPPGISKEDKAKLDGFNNTLTNLCLQLGVPWLEASFAIKGEKTPPFEATQLNAAGLEQVGALALSVLKHLELQQFTK